MSPAAEAADTPGVRSSDESPRPSSADSSAAVAHAEAGAALRAASGPSAGPPAGGEDSISALLLCWSMNSLPAFVTAHESILRVNFPWAHYLCCSAGQEKLCLAATTATPCESSVRVTFQQPHRLLVTAADETVQEADQGTAAGAAGAGGGFQVEVCPRQKMPAPPAVANNTAVGTQPTPTSSQTGCQTSLPGLSDSHSPSDPQRSLPSRVQGRLLARGHAALGPRQTTSGGLAPRSSKEAAPPASTSTALHGSQQRTSAWPMQLATHQDQEETAGGSGRLSSQRRAGGLGTQALDRGDSAAEQHMRWAERRRQGGMGADSNAVALGAWAGSGCNKGKQPLKSIIEVSVMILCVWLPSLCGHGRLLHPWLSQQRCASSRSDPL